MPPRSPQRNSAGSYSMRDRAEYSFPTHIIDYIVSVIMSSIPSGRTSQASGLCALSFANAVEHLMCAARPPGLPNKDQDMFTYPHLRKRHPDFFNAIVPFVLSISSEEHIKTLESRFPRCKCNHGDPRIQALHGYQHTRRTFLIILSNGVFNFLLALASLSSETLFRSLEAGTSNRNKRRVALNQASQYILDATRTRDTIRAATCWYKVTGHYAILAFAARCFLRHGITFKDPACAPSSQEFISVVVSRLRELMQEMQQDLSSVTVDHAILLHDLLGVIISTINISGNPSRQSIWDSAVIFFTEIFDSLDSSKQALFRARPPLHSTLAGLAIAAVDFKPDGLPHAEKIMSHFDGAAQLMGVRRPYLEAWTLLTDLHQKKDCANPRCVTSPRAQRFPKCAQCRIPSYCSRECQIEAWAFAECPHKVVCKAWSILMKYWPTGFNSKEDRKPAAFPPFLNVAQKDAWLKSLLEPSDTTEEFVMMIPFYFANLLRLTRESRGKSLEDLEGSNTSVDPGYDDGSAQVNDEEFE